MGRMLRRMRLAPCVLAVIALASTSACQRHEEQVLPPPPPPAAPVSLWTEADSQAIAKQLVESALRDSWTSQFRDRNARAATVAIGEITDRSGRQVPIDGLKTALVAALGAVGGDKLSAGADASDFVLSGVLGASAGTNADGTAATFFSIDLSVKERASGDATWHFAIERPIADR